MDLFPLISSICDLWICNVRSDCVRWKRLRGLRRGCVIFRIVDLVKAVNAWIRVPLAMFLTFTNHLGYSLLVLARLKNWVADKVTSCTVTGRWMNGFTWPITCLVCVLISLYWSGVPLLASLVFLQVEWLRSAWLCPHDFWSLPLL